MHPFWIADIIIKLEGMSSKGMKSVSVCVIGYNPYSWLVLCTLVLPFKLDYQCDIASNDVVSDALDSCLQLYSVGFNIISVAFVTLYFYLVQ